MTDESSDTDQEGGPWRLIEDNSLSIALFSLFLVCLAAQSAVGWRAYNDSLSSAHFAKLSWSAFLLTGTFQNAIFSNWQAAILQLGVLISFSTVLRQRGAAHSRKGDGEKNAKLAANRRKIIKNFQFNPFRKNWLYNNSLSLVMFALFAAFFALHAWTSNRAYNEEQLIRHVDPEAMLPYLISPAFWFVNFQTWEAEFFAIGAYIVLSIFLRQERSPESKTCEATNSDTGDTND